MPSIAAVTRKAGSARPKIDMSEPNDCHGSLIGTTPNPPSERRRGSIIVHENTKAMRRKAATG